MEEYKMGLAGKQITIRIRENARDHLDVDIDEFTICKIVRTIGDKFNSLPINSDFMLDEPSISKVTLCCNRRTEDLLVIFCMVAIKKSIHVNRD